MAKYIKPTKNTKFHIDFNWWLQPGKNFHRYLLSHACDTCRALLEENADVQTMDWVDPETARVFSIDQLWHEINHHCAGEADFIPKTLPLTESVFRLFILNNNLPLSPVEMEILLDGRRDARTILRTIGGHKVYKGIRPVSPLVSR